METKHFSIKELISQLTIKELISFKCYYKIYSERFLLTNFFFIKNREYYSISLQTYQLMERVCKSKADEKSTLENVIYYHSTNDRYKKVLA